MVSIVLPVYNGGKYLKEAIDIILSQTYRNIELVVVNDCSTDKSLCIIKEYMEKDDRVKLVNNETNQKLPKSLNIGFEHCRGDYYTWTSDDNIMKPNAINRMLEVMKKEDADLVFSRCETINAEGKKIGESELYKNLDEIYYNNIVLASFLYKKEVHEKLHGYDTTKFLVEDYDFWLRAYQKFKFVYIPEILYKIRFHGKNLGVKHLEEVKLKKIELLKENIRYVNDQQILDGIYREISNCYFEISNSYYYKLTDVNNKNRIRKYRMKDLIKKLLNR